MRRWYFFALILAVAVILFWQKEDVVTSPEVAVETSKPVERLPAQAPAAPERVIPPRVRRVASSAVIKVAASEIFPSENRPILAQAGRQWRFLEGAVAVSDNDPRIKDLPVLSRRPGFVILAQGDVPAGVEALQLVERTDNKLLGIFTGVLKAMGKSALHSTDQFQSACPSEIKESYPAIQSYLLKAAQDNHEEFKTCLSQTGLFKRLDWEILSTARITQ